MFFSWKTFRILGWSLILGACVSQSPRRKDFVLQEDFSGRDFFKHFQYDAIPDPTGGYVTYVNKTVAELSALTYVNSSGHAIIAADSTNVPSGDGRNSIRLKSLSTFTTGLFIVDVEHMPEGMGTWPAFWSFGPNWPGSGEIDLIEGVNNHSRNQITLHAAPICKIDSHDCSSANGCTTSNALNTFGPGFNQTGGGVFALLWTPSAIQAWYWPHRDVPSDALSLKPDPNHWGLPNSYFRLGKLCSPLHFASHNLLLNTTFCGSWASADYPGGATACKTFVKNNPAEFANAYWEIASLRVYQIPQ